MVLAKELRKKENLEKIPNDKTGYYKWWADRTSLDVLLEKLNVEFNDIELYLEKKDNLFCIYVGIAVKESIRDRLNWHINDKHDLSRVNSGFLSTFRKSISSVVLHNQYDKEGTNNFIDKLYVEYFIGHYPIKSNEAKEEIENIEYELISKYLRILNIKDNKHIKSNEIKKVLKKLRKESK